MSKFKDLTGQRFGRLTVIKRVENKGKNVRYLCKCDCGNETIVYSTNLIRGLTTSCGCYRKEKLSQLKLEDLTGQKFGRLTVIKLNHYDENARQYYWLCICECGNECIVYGGHLKDGHTSSCGCYNKERISESRLIDLTGQRFGKLVVIKRAGTYYSPSGTSTPTWLCRCDCGGEVVINASSLKGGYTQSCGCISSMGEELIARILRENHIDFKPQYSFSDLRSNKNRKLFFDFGILNNNQLQCLIEYQGRQHYIFDQNWKQTKEDFEEGLKRDEMKRQYCKKHNIKLIEIPYWEFSKINWEYLQTRIM